MGECLSQDLLWSFGLGSDAEVLVVPKGTELLAEENAPARGGGCLNRRSRRFDRVLEDPENSSRHNIREGGTKGERVSGGRSALAHPLQYPIWLCVGWLRGPSSSFPRGSSPIRGWRFGFLFPDLFGFFWKGAWE